MRGIIRTGVGFAWLLCAAAACAAPAADGKAATAAGDSTSQAIEPGLAARRARYARPTRERIAMLPAHLLRLPFRIVNYPIEHYLIHREPGAVTVYAGRALRRLRTQSLYVGFGELGSESGYGPGLRYDVMPWSRGPRLSIFGATTHRGYDEVYARLDSIPLGRARLELRGQYDERPQEDFFGLGPDSHLEDHATFQQDETLVRARARLPLRSRWSLVADVDWSRSDIGRGRDPKFPSVEQVFPPLAGLAGRYEFVDVGAGITYDSRDPRGYARRGQFMQAFISASEGTGGAPQAYTKVRFEAAQFVPLPGWRRSLVGRVRVAFTDNRASEPLPAFRLERIGGGRTLRGYYTYRFQEEESLLGNVEYRFPIWTIDPPGGLALDGCAFFDFGTAVPELSDLQQRDLRSSAGLGIRFTTATDVVVRIDHGRTAEGHRTHFSLRGTF